MAEVLIGTVLSDALALVPVIKLLTNVLREAAVSSKEAALTEIYERALADPDRWISLLDRYIDPKTDQSLDTGPLALDSNSPQDSTATPKLGDTSSTLGEGALLAQMREMKSPTDEVAAEERRRRGALEALGTISSFAVDTLFHVTDVQYLIDYSQSDDSTTLEVVETRAEAVRRRMAEMHARTDAEAKRAVEAADARARYKAWCEGVVGPAIEEDIERIAREHDRDREEDLDRQEEVRKQVKEAPCCSERKGHSKVEKATSTPLLQPQPGAFRHARPGLFREVFRKHFPDEARLAGWDTDNLQSNQRSRFHQSKVFDWARQHGLEDQMDEAYREMHPHLYDNASSACQDLGPKVDNALDDATFLTHQDWEQRFEEVALRRKEQEQPTEPKEEHSTGIIETIKTWATGLWKKVKTAVWG